MKEIKANWDRLFVGTPSDNRSRMPSNSEATYWLVVVSSPRPYRATWSSARLAPTGSASKKGETVTEPLSRRPDCGGDLTGDCGCSCEAYDVKLIRFIA